MAGLRLMAELGLDGSGFRAGFNQARGIAEGVAEGIKGLVVEAVGVYAIEQAIHKTVETAKELIETSERLAIAPETLQVMRQAAKQTGVEFEKLAVAMEKVGVARERALIPGEEGFKARRAFAGFGIGIDQLHTQSTAQLLLGGIRSQVLNRNPEELGVLFRDLGVKFFGQLIPYLKTDFDGLREKMQKFGAIMSTDTALKLKLMSSELSILSQVVISNLAPALVFLAEKLFQFAGQVQASYNYWKEIFKGPSAAGQIGPAGTPVPSGILGSLYMANLKREANDLNYPQEYRDRVNKFLSQNVNPNETALQKFNEVTEKWSEQLKEIQAKIAEEAERLKNPPPPDLTQSSLPEKMSKKVLETPTDPLVRIGNFLGAGNNRITQLAEKRTQLLQQIANNTKPRPEGRRHFTGDAEPTFFPTV